MRTSKIPVLFDKPRFALRVADSHQMYALVDNELEVSYAGQDFSRYVDVPTELFTLMKFLRVAPDQHVTLFLEEDGPFLLFGMIVSDEVVHDLWHYAVNSVPPAMLSCE